MFNLRRLLHLLCFLFTAAADDLQTLLSIKSVWHHPINTDTFTSWQPDTPACSFHGITCNSDGQVVGIELSNNNLTGLLPTTSICQLASLEKLSLGFNNLHGLVGEDLNNCLSLRYLDLGNNFLSGPFPDLSSLNRLVYMHLNGSNLSGKFPWNSLQNMSNLRVLSLGDNPFDQSPFPLAILNLTNLNWLYLSNCNLSGELPEEIGNLVELINLELSQNYFTGKIPGGISRLSNLWQLELYSNGLTGGFPPGFGRLTNLEYFDASANRLEGNLSEIRLLNKLKSLQLYDNHLSGGVPDELGDFRSLVNLSLYRNNLTGQLPWKLGSWADFHFIDVSENFLTGTIPPNMCKRGTMTKLLMLQNKFVGEIPGSYADCRTLVRFRVSKNRLSGQVPGGIWGLPRLEIIDIADNDLSGPVTPDIGNAKSLARLFVSNNRLSGELPLDISRALSLESIDMSNNQFTGEVPEAIGELKQLTGLQLQGNRFSGQIPDSLSSCYYMNEINMAGNMFSGVIPTSLGSVTTLNYLNLSRNHLSGPIPDSLSSLRLNLLDLSHNQLVGPIPASLLSEANNDIGSFMGNDALCSDKIMGFGKCSPRSSKPRTVLFCLMMVSIAIFASLAGFFCYVRRKSGSASMRQESWDVRSFHVLTFTEDEILDSIKEENLIGKGGSGNVYRAVIGNGKELAIKHIYHTGDYGKKVGGSTPILSRRSGAKSWEFEAEVETLSSIRHVNVVKLYCSITSEDSSLLVYEYMQNGSLYDRLHGCNKKQALDWETRYEVALGAANGLEYLHHGCDRPVIHRDVKSSNILLDEHLKSCIADFGLAKVIQPDHSSQESTLVIAGTRGYIAPEYAYMNKVNEKSDVYSFGVVLMELVTGRRPVGPEFGESKDIVDWVCENVKTQESVVTRVLDLSIGEADGRSAIKVLKVALHCTAKIPSLRPTMRRVVQMLEEAKPARWLVKDSDQDKKQDLWLGKLTE